MTHFDTRWLTLILLLVTTTYAIAEDITLTTYYPSPRGVYAQLRVGAGTPAVPPGSADLYMKPSVQCWSTLILLLGMRQIGLRF